MPIGLAYVLQIDWLWFQSAGKIRYGLWVTTLFLLGSLENVSSQQLPPQRGYLFQGLLWNPALTAPSSSWEAGAHYTQQWVSFPGAPSSGWAYAQIPFSSVDMGLGLICYIDQAGPFSNPGGQINYAYHLVPGLVYGDRLSLGLLARMSRLRFDATKVVARDGADPLFSDDLSGEWNLDAGTGLFYTTHDRMDFDRNAWYLGFTIDQLSRNRLGFGGPKELWQNVPHLRFLFGHRNVRFNRCWEPSFFVDLATSAPIRGGAQLRYEQDRAFWAQIGGEITGSVRMGGGYIFIPDLYSQRQLLIGVDVEYGLSSIGRQSGLSYQLSLAWRGIIQQ